jgi:hypothetical protein
MPLETLKELVELVLVQSLSHNAVADGHGGSTKFLEGSDNVGWVGCDKDLPSPSFYLA